MVWHVGPACDRPGIEARARLKRFFGWLPLHFFIFAAERQSLDAARTIAESLRLARIRLEHAASPEEGENGAREARDKLDPCQP